MCNYLLFPRGRITGGVLNEGCCGKKWYVLLYKRGIV